MGLLFSKVLEERLQGKNLSAVAREVGIPRAVLHDWVKGKRLPSLRNIELVKQLADYLGLSLEQIIFGDKSKSNNAKSISSVRFSDENRHYEVIVQRIEGEPK